MEYFEQMDLLLARQPAATLRKTSSRHGSELLTYRKWTSNLWVYYTPDSRGEPGQRGRLPSPLQRGWHLLVQKTTHSHLFAYWGGLDCKECQAVEECWYCKKHYCKDCQSLVLCGVAFYAIGIIAFYAFLN